MKRQSPPIAMWLVTLFVTAPNADEIIGDITERYHAGRSPVWFWWQVVMTIITNLRRTIRTQPFICIRAIAIAWSIVFISIPLQQQLVQFVLNPGRWRTAWTSRLVRPDLMPPTGWSAILPNSWTLTSPWDAKNGWLSPWGGADGWLVPWGSPFGLSILGCVFALALGWLIGRLHRPFQMTVVLLFVLSWFTLLMPGFAFLIAKTAQDWSLPFWRYGHLYYLASFITTNGILMLFTFAGGVLNTARRRQELQGGTV